MEKNWQFDFVVEGLTEAEVIALWDELLAILPAGRVGGGYYESSDNWQDVIAALEDELATARQLAATDEEE